MAFVSLDDEMCIDRSKDEKKKRACFYVYFLLHSRVGSIAYNLNIEQNSSVFECERKYTHGWDMGRGAEGGGGVYVRALQLVLPFEKIVRH